jgi:ubiquinone/menaquinone biosynthesis C-methylase UbiE
MSHFGWETSAKYLPHVMFKDAVYLGVPSDIFKPLYSKDELKKVTGFDDKFVILTVGRHQPRKMIWKTTNAVAKFLRTHPDAVWYCKTNPADPAMNDYPENERDLISILTKEGVIDRTFFEPRMFSQEQMNEYYNTGDVFIHLSGGEGFGIPYVESMMAGIPCILSNNTTSPELTGGWEFGLPVKISGQVTLKQFNSTYDLADEDDAIRQLEFAYNDWKNGSKWLKEAGKKAREFHKQWCEVEKVVDRWEEYFHKIIEYNENPKILRDEKMVIDEKYFADVNKYNQSYHRDWTDLIIKYMNGLEGNTLDVGCGTGYIMTHLLSEGKNIVGIDTSDWAVEHPMPDCTGRIFKGDITDIPYDDKTFDNAIVFSVLEHIPEKDTIQALKEIKRVSKKAFLLIAMIMEPGHREKLEAEDPTHINIQPLAWWEDKLKEVGLKVVMRERMAFVVESMEG